ncbi:acetyl-CoA carboxylase carboxyltransferase subunit alpha/beta [Haloactinopolyspora sp.]|uniref:acetyl-CoA carboxylase carboxyltransferase subunit alpha/beta n=1 Tax=Haloactinopolyspora sp. TaxID=1966353 RepID=UPI0026393CC8|nr:acetyl-CoA carboxylase carboxyltransferase subunit alpha/beta [Haloactinopolyspora sp.]
MSDKVATCPEWVLCDTCRAIVYRKRWIRSKLVCPECGHHTMVDGETRLEQLADPGSLKQLDRPQRDSPDVLGFVDTMPYPRRLAEARAKTGLEGAVTSAQLCIEGSPAVVAVMDFRFLGGSLGVHAGSALIEAADAALERRLPLIVVTASGGARMQEGAIALMQMARTSAAWERLDSAGLLTISVVTDPTFGGVAASFATLSDVIVGEMGARLGFAGRRVIEQTIGKELPDDFQTVEFLLERGFVDMVLHRQSLRAELAKLLRAASPPDTSGEHAEVAAGAGDSVVRDSAQLPADQPWDQVRLSRDLTRPTMLDYVNLVFDDFRELSGDRVSGECPAMVTGLARLAGRRVVVIGQQKGHTLEELSKRNFGMAYPAGYRKAARVMRLAAKLSVPVVTLVDTPGAYPGEHAEEQGQAGAIAENLRLMMSLPVPIVTVVTGEGGSGGALGIAVANRVLIWQHATYSVISPEGCASILWKDSAQGPAAAAALGLSARELLRLGVVDGVLTEPDGGVGADPMLAAERLRSAITASLDDLGRLDADQLKGDRMRRFSAFGSFDTADMAGITSRWGVHDEMAG